MCGRIVKKPKRWDPDYERWARGDQDADYRYYRDILRLDAEAGGRRGYNINPGEEDLVFIHAAEGEPVATPGFWGLEPQWVREKRGAGARFFNCKSERAYPDGPESMIYEVQIKRRRAILVIDGYYEWKWIGPRKTDKEPWFVYRADDAPMVLGCFYALRSWGASFGIVTTTPNDRLALVHDRAPVVLDPTEIDRWLDPELQDPNTVRDLVMPSPPDWFAMHPVAPLGGRDEPEMIEAVKPQQAGLFGSA